MVRGAAVAAVLLLGLGHGARAESIRIADTRKRVLGLLICPCDKYFHICDCSQLN